MSTNVRYLLTHDQITSRICPGCGYEEDQRLIEASRINLECPRCRRHKQSEFLPIKGNKR